MADYTPAGLSGERGGAHSGTNRFARRGLWDTSGGHGTGECLALLDETPRLGTEMLILTGGEPFLRKDVYDGARRPRERRPHGRHPVRCRITPGGDVAVPYMTVVAGNVRDQTVSEIWHGSPLLAAGPARSRPPQGTLRRLRGPGALRRLPVRAPPASATTASPVWRPRPVSSRPSLQPAGDEDIAAPTLTSSAECFVSSAVF